MVVPQIVYNLIKTFFLLLLLGILFANVIFVVLSVIPLLLAILGSYSPLPSGIKVNRHCSLKRACTGDLIHVTLEVWIEKGMGIVFIADELPGDFKVMEGSNFKVFWKGREKRKETFTYSMRCTISGTYCMEKVQWESRHFLYRQMAHGKELCKTVIEIHPKAMEIQKIKNAAALARIPMPKGSETRVGMSTLEFKEMRLYTYGDSFRGVNWKATARNIYRGGHWPIINEYDKEGKKEVWLYMDVSQDMEFGRSARNALECGLEAVNGLAEYYLKQNCSVSFCTYNGRAAFVAPGTGQRQHYRIIKELVQLNEAGISPSDGRQESMGSLEDAVAERKSYFTRVKPLFVIVTRQNGREDGELSEGIREAGKYASIQKGRLQIMVINISGYDLAVSTEADKAAAGLLEVRDGILSRNLKGKCIWIDWNPEKGSFLNALLTQAVGI